MAKYNTPEEAYQAAQEKIEHAIQDEITELNFNNLGLSKLPPEIGQLTQLTSLHLMNNQLTSVPPEIGQLT
ncbi:MAG: hypothetical protein GY869_29265, partial [Planctomycetes bacterium]|nr:hypothetical protein [Planctomycetota bacterium]